MAFIKIDRRLLDSYSFSNPNYLKIWLWILLKANYKKSYASIDAGAGISTIEINRGQMLFGRHKAEIELNLSGSLIYRALKKFEQLGQITLKTNNKYTIITVCKYDCYQNNDSQTEQLVNSKWTASEQPVNSQWTASEQLVNTSKEYQEDKEYKEERDSAKIELLKNSNLFKQPVVPSKEEVLQFFVTSGGNKEMAKSFYEKYDSTGWMLNGSPVVNFRSLASRFIANWIKNDTKKNSPVPEQQTQTLKKLPTYIQPKYD
jgi:hypothetical protein